MIVVGALYFFSISFAKDSPIVGLFNKLVMVIVGEIGIHIFFGLMIVAGVTTIAKDGLSRTIMKQFIILNMVISAMLNFPALEEQTLAYQSYGGYIGWPILWILQRIFGENPFAIKAIIVAAALAIIAWIIRAFNIPVPRLPSVSMKSGSSNGKPESKKVKRVVEEYEDEEDEEESPAAVVTKKGSAIGDSLKSMLKDKIQNKIKEKEVVQKIVKFPKDKPTFDIKLLEEGSASTFEVDQSYLEQKALAIQAKLEEFDIPIDIKWFNIGPSVVQIKVAPQEGIRVSSIESYQKDIALSLKTKSLRILAPIPGTDVVGIEIPNPKPQMIRVRQILGSPSFAESMNKNLTNLVLGIGIDGKHVTKPLEDMPHLLVAGATGSGKSVGVNTFILSLIYQNSPSELKFLMVDPKQVELGMYDGIPYLLAPVETSPDKALKILKWTVQEMERRYTLLKEYKVKKLDEYNKKVTGDTLPRIVVVIDELADLMMNRNTKKDTENCITRIAQKARAVGIHLIVATQRPSVDVVTGLIKANIPTRIAFSVVSQIDSRTILDTKGAEELLGRWDMLFMSVDNNTPVRLQWPFIDTPEIEEIVQAIKDKYMKGISEEDIYNVELMNILSGKNVGSGMGGWFGDSGDDEELVQQATQVILQTRKASATLLQRKLGVWFARAARIMDILEERGVVWPQEGAKPRDIYM